jgi:hypothetical protein
MSDNIITIPKSELKEQIKVNLKNLIDKINSGKCLHEELVRRAAIIETKLHIIGYYPKGSVVRDHRKRVEKKFLGISYYKYVDRDPYVFAVIKETTEFLTKQEEESQ